MMAKTLPRDTAGAGSVPVLPPLTENGARPPGFVAVDYEVFIDSSLSPAANLLFARLKLYAGTNGLAYPKHRTLAREMCMRDRQVRTLLNELRALNRINWRRTRTSCIFEIKPPLEWKKTSALNLRGEQVPDPGVDSRAEENFLSDRKFSSALDRKKTSDRREVLKRGSKTKNRQADSSSGIERPDSVGVDVGVRSQEERQKP